MRTSLANSAPADSQISPLQLPLLSERERFESGVKIDVRPLRPFTSLSSRIPMWSTRSVLSKRNRGGALPESLAANERGGGFKFGSVINTPTRDWIADMGTANAPAEKVLRQVSKLESWSSGRQPTDEHHHNSNAVLATGEVG